MKKIRLKDFNEEMGTFIDLEVKDENAFKYKNEINVSYEKLIVEHKELLNKDCKYYIYCQGGQRSKKAVNLLEFYGYDVTLVYK